MFLSSFRVIDQIGRVVLRKAYFVESGSNQLQIKTETLAHGIYEVELFDSKKHQHIRMMKE